LPQFVCLFVCYQDYSKNYGKIIVKFFEGLALGTRNNCRDFEG